MSETDKEARERHLAALAENTAAIDTLNAERIDHIEQAKWLGAPVTEIAKAAGITRQQVHRILAERKAQREAIWKENETN